jgi:hypothetical protein
MTCAHINRPVSLSSHTMQAMFRLRNNHSALNTHNDLHCKSVTYAMNFNATVSKHTITDNRMSTGRVAIPLQPRPHGRPPPHTACATGLVNKAQKHRCVPLILTDVSKVYSETSVSIYQTTRFNIPEDSHLQSKSGHSCSGNCERSVNSSLFIYAFR